MTIKNLTPHQSLPEGSREIIRIYRQPSGGTEILLAMPEKDDSSDPGVWGIIAVDLLRHAANMLDEVGVFTVEGKETREDILARMKVLFDAEWAKPTDTVRRVCDS